MSLWRKRQINRYMAFKFLPDPLLVPQKAEDDKSEPPPIVSRLENISKYRRIYPNNPYFYELKKNDT